MVNGTNLSAMVAASVAFLAGAGGCIDERNVDGLADDAAAVTTSEPAVRADAAPADVSVDAVQDADTAAPVVRLSDAEMEGAATAESGAAPMACKPIRAQRTPARLETMSQRDPNDPAAGTRTVYFDDMFNLFKGLCGQCHIDVGLGGYQVQKSNFAQVIDDVWLNSMLIEDEKKIMPTPSVGGRLPSLRPEGDPTTQLVAWMKAWMAQGKPMDAVRVQVDGSARPSPYVLSADARVSMTNLGSCVPDPAIVGTATAKMDELDALFSQLFAATSGSVQAQIALPARLDQTDLFTLDTEVLARHGTIAYAPAYPVWTDDARDQRFVRVPRGQSIVFDKTTQQFQIPSNTRFYRTILKRVVDKYGFPRWRKLETRLIVARPDDPSVVGGGTKAVTALYGTYQWDDDEKEARLLADPLRSGAPFRDRLVKYVTDESVAAAVASTHPLSLLDELQKRRALRTYAIPGSWRCVGCHMGSSSRSFVLGFTPMQLNRRAQGEEGIIDPVEPDELNQVRRLMDAGVISGLSSSAEIVPLRASQGSRKPRNDHELVAQGYILANCAHCHTARAWATVDNPELASAFDLFPSETGGIFQFPLDRMSPRATRGAAGSTPIPYITPSLMDLPAPDTSGVFYWPKAGELEVMLGNSYQILAPWRSLVYRGVDTPFSYSDDLALFPHMPMATPGFDCRAPQILGDWMVSIPAVRTNQAPEYDYGPIAPGHPVDDSVQPYKEIGPNDSRYAYAVSQAQTRLDAYHSGAAPYSSPQFFPFTLPLLSGDVRHLGPGRGGRFDEPPRAHG